MAKVGILGQRRITIGSSQIQPGDLKGFGLNYYGSDKYILSGGACLVYKVPADVKMAVVDIDGMLINGAAVYIVDNSEFDSRTEIFNAVGTGAYTGISRKCMVLGPGQAIYVTPHNTSMPVMCLVTGIEHV